MKLVEIKIRGYKSIDELDFPIQKYGKSYTTILLGKNETGKSNVLDAIAMTKLADSKESETSFTKIRNRKTKPNKVSVLFNFSVENTDDFKTALLEAPNIELPDSLVNSIKLTNIVKEAYIKDGDDKYGVAFDFLYDTVPRLNSYGVLVTTEEVPAQATTPPTPAKTIEKITVKKLSSITDKEEASKYLELSDDLLKGAIKKALLSFATKNTKVVVDRWEYEPRYLIQDKIKLDDFVQNKDNIPLENIFYLAGYKTYDEIAKVIEEIKKDDNERRSLSTNLTDKATEYLHKKWKEHKVDIDVEVGNDYTVKVSVKDEADTGNYYDMTDRSQGFKQFASLLFSISIGSASGSVKNHVILIDEPEVHLHPSGVRHMRDELLKIGESNYLFISTHSNFMIDSKQKERHHLLTKGDDNSTEKKQIKTEENINNDEVLETAFGINIILDFVSPHLLLVEGDDDKRLLEKALSTVKPDNDIKISNGTGSNIVADASRLAFHDVVPLVVSDDDEDGRKYQTEILKIGKNDFKNKALTLYGLTSEVTEKGTIEDAIPVAFVQDKANEVLHDNGFADITLDISSPFCEQIKLHLQKEIKDVKGKAKTAKVNNLATVIKGKVAEYPIKDISAESSPVLVKLAEAILAKFEIS